MFGCLSSFCVPTPRSGSWLPTQHCGQIRVCLPGSRTGQCPSATINQELMGNSSPAEESSSPSPSKAPSPLPACVPPCQYPHTASQAPCLPPETAAPSQLVLLGSTRKWQITAQHLLSALLHLCRHRIIWKQEETETADNSISDKRDGNWPKD